MSKYGYSSTLKDYLPSAAKMTTSNQLCALGGKDKWKGQALESLVSSFKTVTGKLLKPKQLCSYKQQNRRVFFKEKHMTSKQPTLITVQLLAAILHKAPVSGVFVKAVFRFLLSCTQSITRCLGLRHILMHLKKNLPLCNQILRLCITQSYRRIWGIEVCMK